jgi:hypothetical protein
MKKRFPLFLFSAIFFCQIAVGQNFHWLTSFGSLLGDNCSKVALDKYGNTYVAGNFGYIAASWQGGEYYETTPLI